MSDLLDAASALTILQSLDIGEDTLIRKDPWPPWGEPRFWTAQGHQITVFSDATCWDYVDTVRHADGRVWTFDDGGEGVRNFIPKHPLRWGLVIGFGCVARDLIDMAVLK